MTLALPVRAVRVVKVVLTGVVAVLVAVAVRGFVGIYSADVAYAKSQELLKQGKVESALEYADKAIQKNPMEPNYYRGRALVYISLLIGSNRESQIGLKDLALRDLQYAYDLNPSNLVTIRNAIPLYFFIATLDILAPGGPGNVDLAYISVTKSFYEAVSTRFPNDAGVQLLLARYERKLGLMEDFEVNIIRVRELRPDLLEWNSL